MESNTVKPARKIKLSNLLNIILTILLVATLLFVYFYLNSKTITAWDDLSQTIDPKPPKFLVNIYGSDAAPLNGPLAVAVGNDGKVYVVDSGNSQIQVFNQHGQLITRFGQFGQDPGQLNYPSSIAVNTEGLIYIGDFNNNRIQVFSHKGRLINTLSKSNLGYAISPLALAFDKEDNLYIANRSGEVMVLDKNGKRKVTFGEPGSKPGYLSYPNGIAIGPSDKIYVSDSGNFRVQVFDSKGKLLETVEQEKLKVAIPKGLAIDHNDRIYVVDNFQHRVNVFDLDWNFLFAFGLRGLNEGELNYPNGIFVKNNKVYITDRENDRVAIFGY